MKKLKTILESASYISQSYYNDDQYREVKKYSLTEVLLAQIIFNQEEILANLKSSEEEC